MRIEGLVLNDGHYPVEEIMKLVRKGTLWDVDIKFDGTKDGPGEDANRFYKLSCTANDEIGIRGLGLTEKRKE